MPSGAAYATGLRDAFEPLLDGGAPRPLGSHLEALGQALRGATGGEGGAAILSEGGDSGAWFEHRELSRRLAVPIVRPEQLRPDGDRLVARLDDRRPVLGALYRRLDEERLSRPDGSLTALGEMLVPALRAGTLRCLNAFGAGVADDKLAHAHVERMVEFYLGEEALLPSVPTFEVGGRGPGAVPPARLGELVVKPRDAFGGQGVTLMPLAGEEERERVLAEVRREPRRFVAQPIVPLSTHPTIRGGRLVRRHVDLRPFVVCAPAGPVAMPGGLTRFAPGADDMVVNSSRGGGCKDTWVIDR
jgi:carboxylate-amine ligase